MWTGLCYANHMKDIITFIIIGAVFIVLSLIAVERHEKVECIRWQEQEAEYPLFYSTQWQKDQCIKHDIRFNK